MIQKKQTRNNFRKAERLCSLKAIAELYKNGESFLAYPLRCVYNFVESTEGEQIRVLISVPKRYHKKAVSRNLLKRRIREAYRLNKSILKETLNDGVALEFSMTLISHEEPDYQTIENAVKKILKELSNRSTIAVG